MTRKFSLIKGVNRLTFPMVAFVVGFCPIPLLSDTVIPLASPALQKSTPFQGYSNHLNLRPEAVLSYSSLYPGGFTYSHTAKPKPESSLGNYSHSHRQLYAKTIRSIYSGKRKNLSSIKSELKNYPLAPYLEYHEFRSAIHRYTTNEVDDYILSNSSLPVAGFLKTRKLFSLARTKQWTKFLAYYSPSSDTRLQCYHEEALLQTQKETYTFNGVKNLWMVGHSQPKSCDKIFNAWLNSTHFNASFAWDRYILALENKRPSLAKFLAKHLSKDEKKIAKRGIYLYRHPAELEYLNDAGNKKHNDLLHISLHRLIQKNPEKAAQLIPELEKTGRLDTTQLSSYQEELATILAVRFHPEAEKWLKIANKEKSMPILNELEIRTALRQLEWEKAYNKINALPEKTLNSDRWQYWRARTLGQIGDTPSSSEAETFHTLAQNRNFYGYLSRKGGYAGSSNIRNPLVNVPASNNALLKRSILSHEGIQRAREFLLLGQHTDARREWYFTMNSFSPEQRLVAAELANEWNVPSLSIRAANSASPHNNFDLRFPIGYEHEVSTHAKQNGIDQGLVFALIRQESHFTPDARSHAGALGMMQILPTTAKIVASQHKIAYRGTQDLLNPNKNIRLGTTYLKQLLKKFDNNEVLAMAAYNAGPHRVSKWFPEETLPLDVWIETIPFKETRNYVKHVLSNQDIYRKKLGLNIEKKPLSDVIHPG